MRQAPAAASSPDDGVAVHAERGAVDERRVAAELLQRLPRLQAVDTADTAARANLATAGRNQPQIRA